MFIIKALLLGLTLAYDAQLVAKLKMFTHNKPTTEEIEAHYNETKGGELVPEWHEEVDQFLQKEDKKECGECVGKVVKYIITTAFNKITEYCNKSPSADKKFCELLKKAPKVLAGMLFVWIRPISDGWFFCLGAGKCDAKKGPKEDNFLTMEEDTRAVVDEMGLDNTMMWGGLDLDSDDHVQVFREMHEIAIDDAFMEEEKALKAFGGELDKGPKPCKKEEEKALKAFGGELDKGPKPCKKCMKKVTCCIMDKVVKGIVAWCKKDDGNKKKEGICKWMKENKAFMFGYLLARIEPWKYAYGYCLPHHKPHHHGEWKPRESKWKMLHKLHGRKWGGYIPADKEELEGMEKPPMPQEKVEHIWE